MKNVVIIGAGASGMSAAYALSLSPEKFKVTVIDTQSQAGGMATSYPIDASKYGADYINDGVQGASPQFYNSYAMFDLLGFKPTPVGFQVSFGNDPEKNFWSNVFPSPILDRFQADIKKFGKVLKIIKKLEIIFAMMEVRTMLKLFRFSKDFGDVIVYPLVALFFGTGQQTPYISSAILERVFMDPSMRLFEYSDKTFLASIPPMRAFPRLSMVFESWQRKISSNAPQSTFSFGREVYRVVRDAKGVAVFSHDADSPDPERNTQGTGERKNEREERFDELIMCTDADAALKILGEGATWAERRVLGNVKYYWDLTVTHNDVEYMKKYYRLEYEKSLANPRALDPSEDKEGYDQVKFAEENFKPLYYIRSYEEDKSRIEMSFDLTNYQPQFKGVPSTGPKEGEDPEQDGGKDNKKSRPQRESHDSSSGSPSGSGSGTPPSPSSQKHSQSLPSEDPNSNSKDSKRNPSDVDTSDISNHVFQTIFLDHEHYSQLWTEGEIDHEKVILKKWWKQQSHAASHYRGTVGAMMFLNGKHHTQYAGAWTVLNMHEIAVVSGFSAAYKLGAPYPFKDDDDCKRLFALHLGLDHASRMRAEDRKGFFM
ncbi:FAD/NAD(P)-binding domain-containing protein [Pterulicium gracile]|uniref:FAD/NAD(P)-binding domain-containing protein n=1 Tax=Pterulicium gracile TaxID=1884261 RepID=A0A5C3Q8N3_9AGAR|nr:FAD/NAD(P)-binding domain-containing protein [Pterula gracilis]